MPPSRRGNTRHDLSKPPLSIRYWFTTTRLAVSPYRIAFILVVLLTAIPAHLRPFGERPVYWGYHLRDVAGNILLYLPLGFFESASRLPIIFFKAAALSSSIEILQIFSAYRYPGPVDVLANIIGAWLGHAIASRSKRLVQLVPVPRIAGIAGCTLILCVILYGIGRPINHPPPNQVSEYAQVLAAGFFVAIVFHATVQIESLALRLFISCAIGFWTGRMLLELVGYSQLGYYVPALSCAGGVLSNWVMCSRQQPPLPPGGRVG